jgi:hypothetical protein
MSPHLIYVYGNVIKTVFATCRADLPILEVRIRDVISTVTTDMLDKTSTEPENRLDIIRVTVYLICTNLCTNTFFESLVLTPQIAFL